MEGAESCLKHSSQWHIVIVKWRGHEILNAWWSDKHPLQICLLVSLRKNQRTTSRPARVLVWTVDTFVTSDVIIVIILVNTWKNNVQRSFHWWLSCYAKNSLFVSDLFQNWPSWTGAADAGPLCLEKKEKNICSNIQCNSPIGGCLRNSQGESTRRSAKFEIILIFSIFLV